MAKEHENAESQPLPTAWTLPAAKSCRFKVACEGEESTYEVINPGDAMLLLDESGEIAWGVRRVFFVRRERDRSIIYFDRFLDFERTMLCRRSVVARKRFVKAIWSRSTTFWLRISQDDPRIRPYRKTRSCCRSTSLYFARWRSVTIQRGRRGLMFESFLKPS